MHLLQIFFCDASMAVSSLTLPTISPSHCATALASTAGYCLGGCAPPRGRRQPTQMRLLLFGHNRRPTTAIHNVAGTGLDAGTIGGDAADSVAGAAASSTSAGRIGTAGASCAGGGACWVGRGHWRRDQHTGGHRSW